MAAITSQRVSVKKAAGSRLQEEWSGGSGRPCRAACSVVASPAERCSAPSFLLRFSNASCTRHERSREPWLKACQDFFLGAWNQVMQGRVNADIVISGSSRATYHYDPRVIESRTGQTTFNIGKVGSQTDVQVAVLKAYLEHNRKPSLIVHNLDAFSFVTTQEIFEPAQYVPYLGDQTLYESLRPFDPNLAKSRYLPLYGYIVEDMNFAWFKESGRSWAVSQRRLLPRFQSARQRMDRRVRKI